MQARGDERYAAEENLRENARRFWDDFRVACLRAGRKESDVRVVAATKCVPQNIVERLPALGFTEAGENRVQEFTEKYRENTPLRWHIIGALQTNKVKYVVGKAVMVQSVDRTSLLEELDRTSRDRGAITDILLEVNIGGEPNKSGISPEGLNELTAAAREKKNLCVRGLMSVPPVDAPTALYEKVRALFETEKRGRAEFDTLSVGMSADYARAIACGSTMIRPGRVLFGSATRT